MLNFLANSYRNNYKNKMEDQKNFHETENEDNVEE
jgi:hypothetical protein